MATDDKHAGLAPPSPDRSVFGNQGRRAFVKHSVLLGAVAAVGPMVGADAAHALGKQAIQRTRGKMMKQRSL